MRANLTIAVRLGAAVGVAFALVAVLEGATLGAWPSLAREVAGGFWLGALSGLASLLSLAAIGAPFRGDAPWLASRVAATTVALWTGLTVLHARPGLLPAVQASRGGFVLAALGVTLGLALGWRLLVHALDRWASAAPTGVSFLVACVAALLARRGLPGSAGPAILLAGIAGGGALAIWVASRVRDVAAERWLDRLRVAAWTVLGLGALACLLWRSGARDEGGRPRRRVEAFLEGPALRSNALLKLGSEVRAVVPASCPSDWGYRVDGARRVELAWGIAPAVVAATAHFRAIVVTPEGRKSVLLDETVSALPGDGPIWFSRTLALPDGTEAGQLVLRVRGSSSTSFWSLPVFSGRGNGADAAWRNVIIVSLDTVRADHLGAYGYARRPTSPEIDDWARTGMLFENASSTAPGTLSSQMSILTGRYPSGHGVSYANWRANGSIPGLPLKTPTIAEALGREGFLTAAFTGSGYFAMPLGYSRGFTEFVSTRDESLGSAASVFEKAFVWLDRHRDDPFFLFLHTYEAHEPYLDQRFVFAEGLSPQDPHALNEARYDGDIRRADEYVGRLRRHLERLGLVKRTLVVIVSDHGEEFGDHVDVWNDGHGHSLFQELVHVPLVVVGPGVRSGRVGRAVDLTAVAPTVLDYLGIEPLAGMDARSLLGLLRGQEDDTSEEGFAFSEDVWIGPAAHAVRSRDWKLIERGEELPERFLDSDARRAIHRRVSALAKEMLFDLGSDPRERTNRMTEDAVTADRLRGLLRRRFGSAARAKSEGDIPVEGEALERLRSLGYVQ